MNVPPQLRAASQKREHLLAGAIALVAALVVFVLATELFPYHSSNHDEGVYLQQASMLLDGQLQMRPGAFGDAVRPWFFVDSGETMYPKYQPLPAGLYAISMALFGTPRVTLAVVAAANVALVYVLGSMAFDSKVGVVSATAFAFAPMTLMTSSVFLPYAPTTTFNLAFAVAYLRSYRTGSVPAAVVAGLFIGTAFFMRPFTAVLFAAPFILHALWELLTAIRDRPTDLASLAVPEAVTRQAATATMGLGFVGLALAYNTYLTGSPLVFPFQAFAPMDGPGFGTRRILGHVIEYTPAVAIESNRAVLYYLLTRWVPAGVVGTLLAVVGLVFSSRFRGLIPALRGVSIPGDATARRLIAGLLVTVPGGNLFFWGNHNVLANPADPADGFLGQFGPFYHFDLLAPVAIFAGAGAVLLWRQRGTVGSLVSDAVPSAGRRAAAVSILAVFLLLSGGVNAAVLDGAVDRNAAQTATYEDAYAPFDDAEFDDAMVFVPTPYGPWLNHPFQYLRNDGGLDGDVLYVLQQNPPRKFELVDAAGDRSLYRYTYRGEWTADPGEREINPAIQELSVREGTTLDGTTTVGIPDRVSHAVVRLETDNGYETATITAPDDSATVDWSLSNSSASLDRVTGESLENATVAVDSVDQVVLKVRLVQQGAGTLTYRQEVAVRSTDDGMSAVWPPERTVCPVVDDCGLEGTYLPDKPDQHRDGVSFETELSEDAT
ncbi:MAG: hypothetical protein ACOCY1_00030 [Halovenus sp.]